MVLFGLGSVAYFCLLLINSVAILNKERFLTPLGLTTASSSGVQQGYGDYAGGVQGQLGDGEVGMKGRAVALVDAVRTLMRIPLIPINIVVIVYEIIFGTGF